MRETDYRGSRHFRDYPLTGPAKIDANDPLSDLRIAGHRPTILINTIQFPRAWGGVLSSEHVGRPLAATLAADVRGHRRSAEIQRQGHGELAREPVDVRIVGTARL